MRGARRRPRRCPTADQAQRRCARRSGNIRAAQRNIRVGLAATWTSPRGKPSFQRADSFPEPPVSQVIPTMTSEADRYGSYCLGGDDRRVLRSILLGRAGRLSEDAALNRQRPDGIDKPRDIGVFEEPSCEFSCPHTFAASPRSVQMFVRPSHRRRRGREVITSNDARGTRPPTQRCVPHHGTAGGAHHRSKAKVEGCLL